MNNDLLLWEGEDRDMAQPVRLVSIFSNVRSVAQSQRDTYILPLMPLSESESMFPQ